MSTQGSQEVWMNHWGLKFQFSEGVDVSIHATPHFWQDIISGRGTQLPIYDFQRKARTGYTQFEASESKVVIVEGTYALRTEIRPFLDIGVGVVSADCDLFLNSSAFS